MHTSAITGPFVNLNRENRQRCFWNAVQLFSFAATMIGLNVTIGFIVVLNTQGPESLSKTQLAVHIATVVLMFGGAIGVACSTYVRNGLQPATSPELPDRPRGLPDLEKLSASTRTHRDVRKGGLT